MERITIYPKKQFKRELQKLAKKEGRSLNNFILKILKQKIQEVEDENK